MKNDIQSVIFQAVWQVILDRWKEIYYRVADGFLIFQQFWEEIVFVINGAGGECLSEHEKPKFKMGLQLGEFPRDKLDWEESETLAHPQVLKYSFALQDC